MMEDPHVDLKCPICLQLAKNAVESTCCGHVFCEQCIIAIKKKYNECPCCKSMGIQTTQSKIARRMISSVRVECTNGGCNMKLHFGDLDQHKKKCPLERIKCIFCFEVFKRMQLAEHTSKVHKKEAMQGIIDLHFNKSVKKVIEKQKDPFLDQRINRDGLMSEIGQTGKYYCGGRLIGKCSCCDGNCGKTNGENCDSCMELDIERLKLDKGYLVNPGGFVCLFDPSGGNYHCGRTTETPSLFSRNRSSCLGGNQCSDCAKVNYSIKIGRYRNLL